MKKTYKIPTLTVVKIKPAHLLAGSFNDPLGETNVDGGAALGREAEFSDWGDDETMNIDF